MKLTYHQATFDLLDITPEIDDAAATTLDGLAQRIGRGVPASMQEWYRLKNTAELIAGNDDHVQSIGRFISADLIEQQRWAGHWADKAADLLPFIVENQGVCLWTIYMNGSDDPPVYTRWKSSDGRWQVCADRFADFVYQRAWDTLMGRSEHCLATIATSLPVKQRLWLKDNFIELPASFSRPDLYSYRFYNAIARLRIDVSANGQADWYIAAHSNLALYHFLRDLQIEGSYLFADVLRELWRNFDESAS